MGNPQGSGGPIEEAAKNATSGTEETIAAAMPPGSNPLEYYGMQAARHANPANTLAEYAAAQTRFIAAQTAMIHKKIDLAGMFDAQDAFLAACLIYLATLDQPAALSLQEAFIKEAQTAIEKKGLE